MERYYNRAGALKDLQQLAKQQGTDLEAAMRAVGLSMALLRQPDERIDFARLCALLEHCALAWDMPDLALRLASHQPLEALGPLGLVTRMAPDLRGVVDGIGIARSILSRVPGVRRELVPGEDVTGEEGLASFVREQSWGHHACGTARIGRADDPLAVVDGDFRVHGIDRLRVVDASVFPDIPGLFIASAVYLISEKAADVIAAAHSTG